MNLPDTPDGKLQATIEMTKAHNSSKFEHPFRIINQQFRQRRTHLRGLTKNHYKMLAVISKCSRPNDSGFQRSDHWLGVPDHLNTASREQPKLAQHEPKSHQTAASEVNHGPIIPPLAAAPSKPDNRETPQRLQK